MQRNSNNTPLDWNELSMKEKAAYIRMGVANGYKDIDSIRLVYNEFQEGGYLYGRGGGIKNTRSTPDNWYMKHKDKWETFLIAQGLSNKDAGRLSGFFAALDGLESGNGTSSAARNGNNYGGMQKNGKNIVYETIEDYMKDKWSMMNRRFAPALKARDIVEYGTILGDPSRAGKGYLYYVADGYDSKNPQNAQWVEKQKAHMNNYIRGMESYYGKSSRQYMPLSKSDDRTVYFKNPIEQQPDATRVVLPTPARPLLNDLDLNTGDNGLENSLKKIIPQYELPEVTVVSEGPEPVALNPQEMLNYMNDMMIPLQTVLVPEPVTATERLALMNGERNSFLLKELEDNIIRNSKLGIYDNERLRRDVEDLRFYRNMAADGGNLFNLGGDGLSDNLVPWKALNNIDYVAVPDTAFTRDKTGAGSIEVMFKDTPAEGYEYGTGYKYPHPMPGHNVIIYNPKDNDAQDIRLDALHIMPQDATYDILRSELAYYADGSDIASNARARMKDDIKKYGHPIPGMDYWDYYNNEVDGFLRNMLIEGSPEYIKNKRYYPNKLQLREWNKELMPYVDKILNYLITGLKPANILPEVIVTAPKKALGGPLVDTANINIYDGTTEDSQQRNDDYIFTGRPSQYDFQVVAEAPTVYWDGFNWIGFNDLGQRVTKGSNFNPSGARIIENPQEFENARLTQARRKDINGTHRFAEDIRNFTTDLVMMPAGDILAEPLSTVGTKIASKIAKNIFKKGANNTALLVDNVLMHNDNVKFLNIVDNSQAIAIGDEITNKAIERGRNKLLNWIESPFYKQRIMDEPLYTQSLDIIEDASQLIKNADINLEDRYVLNPTGGTNGITQGNAVLKTVLNNGTELIDADTGLTINIADDLSFNADDTTLHELLHYMTNNSKGSPNIEDVRIINGDWLSHPETHYDAINKIFRSKSSRWQDYILDLNDSLLPKYDTVVELVMKNPEKAVEYLKKAGRSETDAINAVNSLKSRYEYLNDIQELRAFLQELFLSKILPNLKNPNSALEIELFLIDNPTILENSPSYQLVQEIRPGTLKDYAKYFSAALGTLPIINKSVLNGK